jgi:hypothetical protein
MCVILHFDLEKFLSIKTHLDYIIEIIQIM